MTAIIILNWNNADDTLSCLDSLVNAKGDFRVYLVDNGSADNSLLQLEHWISSHQEIDVVLIPLDKNYGFASGNNKGIAIASKDNPDSYLLLNNDTEVTPDFLTNLKAFQAKNPKYKVLTPLIYFHGCKSKIWNAGGRLKFGKRKYYYSNQSASAIKEQEYIPITFVTGCALFFQPEILDENKQIFTERFFFGEEDIEFSMRMKKMHTGMACVLDSVIYQARPLYAIYNHGQSTTLQIRLSRSYNDDKEQLIIEEAMDSEFRNRKNELELVQQSLVDDCKYWLDKGEFELTIK